MRRPAEFDRPARERRSQLYQDALAEYLPRREPAPVTAALDDLVEQLGEDRDQWLSEAGRHLLERSE